MILPKNTKKEELIPVDRSYFLFAGRRIEYFGEKCLILIQPKSGRHFYVKEELLSKSYISLGDFLHAKRTTRRILYDFEKVTQNFDIKVEGDIAFIENFQCKLVEIEGIKVFQGYKFGDIICKEPLELGKYFIRVHLLEQSFVTEQRQVIHFEGEFLKPIMEKYHLKPAEESKLNENKEKVGELNLKSSQTGKKVDTVQSFPTKDIKTEPSSKIVFNAPFDRKIIYHFKVINSSTHRIGFGIKTNNRKRFEVEPKFGVLDPNESVLVSISCDSFDYEKKEINNDNIIIGWINTPDGSSKEFRREWFLGNNVIRHKNLPIDYNM